MGAFSDPDQVKIMQDAGADFFKEPSAPRMAGTIRPKPPTSGQSSTTGQEFRTVGDFRDFR